MFRAMGLWTDAAHSGEMDLPKWVALPFAYTTAPVIGILWFLSHLSRKKKQDAT